jgi:predicted aspartyl protease
MQQRLVQSQLEKRNPRAASNSSRLNALMEAEAKRQRIMADSTSMEAQLAIEEAIRKQNILHNLEAALEANPESFGHIDMLYVHCEIDGHPIDAFVDTGAQATISTVKEGSGRRDVFNCNWRTVSFSDAGMRREMWYLAVVR